MIQNRKKLAILIAGGEGEGDKESKYSDMSSEGLEISMRKFISAVKYGDASKASNHLKTWFDICQGHDDDDFTSSKNNSTSFDDEY